jgi:RHH-type proline utilization regulon transcriptional repressor/proline dehydrogenase/delta 1-pyrroline-5-carboxylate dehydrogenase
VINRQNGWPVPVFLNKEETDRNFDDLTTILLENSDTVRSQIATHNVKSMSHAIAVAEALALPKEAFEFQVIYGMAEPLRSALQKRGHRVRVYTPIGKLIPGMAYLIRRLLENTSNESFLRQTFYEDSTESGATVTSRSLTHPPSEEDREQVFRNEATLDFSRAENRQRMTEALERVRNDFGQRYPLIIGKAEVWTDIDNASVNPSQPDEVIGRVSQADTDQVEQAIEKAREAWTSWRKTPPEERAGYLQRAAERLREQRFDLIALEVLEVGKSWKEADGDITEAIDFLEYYAREMVTAWDSKDTWRLSRRTKSIRLRTQRGGSDHITLEFPHCHTRGHGIRKSGGRKLRHFQALGLVFLFADGNSSKHSGMPDSRRAFCSSLPVLGQKSEHTFPLTRQSTSLHSPAPRKWG